MVYNYVLAAGVVSWFIAQIIKTILNFIKFDKFNAERLIGAGGMPSSHTAMVVSAVTAVGRTEGVGSTVFAVMFLLAAIVIYDAMGVRRAAGMHAKEINNIKKLIPDLINSSVSAIKDGKKVKVKELQEYLGHTPLEVIGGAILGFAVALIVPVNL
ncbi:MAG TPA: acid phosphatase [Ruminococcus sp.]|nr:acid phosphatase [Ruminococcus sp.]HBN11105.1 acid phosphatase [Ruminococcus sp.]HCR74702.1 acid phosphatase [Ruminococcus sp.]